MSGIATKKSGSDRGVQLTYPAVFQEVYASKHYPLSYFPEAPYHEPIILIGDDFQARVHQQRREDANAMVRAKVQATHNMNVRANTGHAGYHLPKPVLGQRRFANPAMGAYFPYSGRQDYADAPFNFQGVGYGSGLSGGVLRTAEGQAFGKAKLLDRVRQLNNIAAAKAAFQLSGMPGVAPGEVAPRAPPPEMAAPTPGVPQTADIGELAKTELTQLLGSVNDQLTTNQDGTFKGIKTTYTDSIRALALIVRTATTGSPEDIENILDFINDGDGIIAKIQALTDPDHDLENRDPAGYAQLATMETYWEKVRDYLNDMLKPEITNRTLKERQEASKIYLKTHGISKAFAKSPNVVAEADPETGTISSRGRTSVSGWSGAPTSDYFPPPSDEDGVPPPREDTEHGFSARSRSERDFTADERQSFGYASGEFYPTGGRATAYFGEDGTEYGAAGVPPPSEADADEFGFIGMEQIGQDRRQARFAEDVGERLRAQERQSVAPSSAASEAAPSLRRALDAETGEHNVIVPSRAAAPAPARARREGAIPIAKAVARARREGKSVGVALAELREGAPSPSSSAVRSAQEMLRSRRAAAERKAPSTATSSTSSASSAPSWFPKVRGDLPNTRQGYAELSDKIIQHHRATGKWLTPDGKPIYLNKDSKLTNVRANFIRRLKLAL